MANNLTGDYEAVLQVAVRQINGLLATMHQNGAQGSVESPSFPHTVRNLRVGELPGYLQPANTHFAQWLSTTIQSAQTVYGPGVPRISGADLAAKAPPGAAIRFRDSLVDLDSAWFDLATPGSVRGRVEVQISTPTISLPLGSTSEVIVSVVIRARYIPDPGAGPLPQPIHGEVQIAYQVRPKNVPDATRAGGERIDFVVDVPPQDGKIVFKDFAGLAASDVATLTAHIRAAIRSDFKPEIVDLPADFRFFDFTEAGGGQAIAIPLQLSANPINASGLATASNLFLDVNTTDFAVAVSKEYIAVQLEPIRAALAQFSQTIPAPDPLPSYRISVTSAVFEFRNGYIELIITFNATTPHIVAPNFEGVVVKQRLTLVLDAANQRVWLRASDNDLTIENLDNDVAQAMARYFFITERDTLLSPPPPGQRPDQRLSDRVHDAWRRLNEALNKFDKAATANFTAVEITPDGVILRGAIDTKYHYQPQMEIGYTEDGNHFSALNSWIPGGRITSYTWYWVENPVFKTPGGMTFVDPWHGEQKQAGPIASRFVFAIPPVLRSNPSWAKGVCVKAAGDQIDRDGRVQNIDGFLESGSCFVTAHEPFLVVDPLSEALYGVHWIPTPRPDALENSIGAHINVLAHPRPAGGLTTNAIVHFVGPRSERPLQALGRALAGMRTQNLSTTLVVVMAAGTFRNRSEDVEEMLGVRAERSNGQPFNDESGRVRQPSLVRLLITEDYGGGWTRTFDARNAPSTYLMNARGEFVWRQQGDVDVEQLARAMDYHFLPAPAARARPLQLTVQPGQRALDPRLEEGHVLGLGKARGREGREIILTFWQSWSAPCVRELMRLQRLSIDPGRGGPVIVAVNGGEPRRVLDDARRQYNLTLTLVEDPGLRISRIYGVTCWPTTVFINSEGIVRRVQFGVMPTSRVEDRGKASGYSQ
jgi:thiol-disulfide isomerase/thioredoxin